MKTPEEWYAENGKRILNLDAKTDQGHLLMSEVMTALKLYGDYRHNQAVRDCADSVEIIHAKSGIPFVRKQSILKNIIE